VETSAFIFVWCRLFLVLNVSLEYKVSNKSIRLRIFLSFAVSQNERPLNIFIQQQQKKLQNRSHPFKRKKIIHWFCDLRDLQKKNSLSFFAFKRSCASSGISVLLLNNFLLQVFFLLLTIIFLTRFQ
jgi:hypothetical protein